MGAVAAVVVEADGGMVVHGAAVDGLCPCPGRIGRIERRDLSGARPHKAVRGVVAVDVVPRDLARIDPSAKITSSSVIIRSVSRAGIARLGVSTSPASTLPVRTGQRTCEQLHFCNPPLDTVDKF